MAALGTVGAVKALVYDAVFKRAQEIIASDKLRSVVFEGEDLRKGTADCIGSSPSDVYVLSLSINGATAVGDCSCPAGKSAKAGLCKHAVSLLLRRLVELQKSKISPLGSPPEEAVISIASQVDDTVARQDERVSADGRETIQSTVAPVPSAASSKRALPAWMLGVVGSAAAGQTQSSTKAKSNKRAAEPKLPGPAPPPTKRPRRSGQPLKISNDSDIEEEGPAEVHDAAPMEKCPAAAAIEDDEVPEIIDFPTVGVAARERRRLRALKKEVTVVADREGNEEVKRTRGQSSRAAKEVSDQPVRAAKRRRLAKKYVEEEDSDGSENGAAQVDADSRNGFELTDEELLFFAQEQLQREKAAGQPTLNAPVEPMEDEEKPENSSQCKKSSSIFSMNRWKEMTSNGKGTSGALSLATDDLDLETLKSFSLAASSQAVIQSDRPSANAEDASDGVCPSLETAEPASASQGIHLSTPKVTECFTTDAVANNMLNIFFGTSLSQESPKKVSAATSTPSASQDEPKYAAARTTSPVPEGVSVTPTVPAVRTDLVDFGGVLKPKKKSSLKDRVEMFLS